VSFGNILGLFHHNISSKSTEKWGSTQNGATCLPASYIHASHIQRKFE
jgi:hypothetical protein